MNIQHNYSTISDLDMRDKKNVSSFVGRIFSRKGTIVMPKLSHGSQVLLLPDKESLTALETDSFDGVVTNVKNLYLTVSFADCFPVFFIDYKNDIIGIAHCGWRGLAGGIISNMIRSMRLMGSEEFSVEIGPGIRKCHFEVKKDVIDAFMQNHIRIIANNLSLGDENAKANLDLPAMIIDMLISEGIPEDKIFELKFCTFCNDELFYSYRRSNTKERNIAVIGMTQ